ncbi:MAG: hypothetical protein JWN76_1157 [Chitinophagaceae bacterium]|nr:hypothetical protein [Chitinophagaceae bacterium]
MDEKLTADAIVCFGEILWDFLPAGPVPGGAPMNVAYHLKKLGHEPKLITRVGKDKWGEELISIMKRNKITTDFIQLDDELHTGKVNAKVGEDNEVSYEILQPVAWDNIQWDSDFEDIISSAKYFVFGSLSARDEATKKTLFHLLELAKYKVLDINLRSPFFNRSIIEDLLNHADLLKLNASELALISGWYTSFTSDADRIKILQERFSIPSIVVTKGEDGAVFQYEGKTYSHPGFSVAVADTVGSGDAFLAAMIFKLSRDSSPGDILSFACALGALIASYNGACPVYNVEDIKVLMKKSGNEISND